MNGFEIVDHVEPRFGGIATSVPRMNAELESQSPYRGRCIAFCFASEALPQGAIRMPGSWLSWLANASARREFDTLVASADVLHVHGLWRHHTHLVAGRAAQHHRPYIVSTHGMLDPWALRNKAWKKKIYGGLVERAHLQKAACVRALTRAEAQDLRAYGVTTPIAVIPNGVDTGLTVDGESFFQAFPYLRGKRLVMFLGRIHYKKGVDMLCRAWRNVGTREDYHLVFVGPDFESTEKALRQLVSELGLDDRVTFAGMLEGYNKWSALSAAHVFVLPSFSEGLSVSTLEALSLGTPVIVSDACNLPEVGDKGAGWVVRPDQNELQCAMNAALTMPDTEREERSQVGRLLVEHQFSWPRVAAQMLELYEWVAGGNRPDNVEVLA